MLLWDDAHEPARTTKNLADYAVTLRASVLRTCALLTCDVRLRDVLNALRDYAQSPSFVTEERLGRALYEVEHPPAPAQGLPCADCGDAPREANHSFCSACLDQLTGRA